MDGLRKITAQDADLTGLIQLVLKVNEDIIKAIVRDPDLVIGKNLTLRWIFEEGK